MDVRLDAHTELSERFTSSSTIRTWTDTTVITAGYEGGQQNDYVLQTVGYCWRTKFQTLNQRKFVISAQNLGTSLLGLSYYFGVRQQYPVV